MFKTLTIPYLLIIIFIFQSGCRLGKGANKDAATKKFEGVITYHEILKSSNASINLDDTVQLYYANGNYVSVHSIATQKPHITKDYYFGNNALRLLLFNYSDTLYQVSLNFPGEKLERFKVKKIKDRIFSRNCESIELSSSYPVKDSVTYTDFSFVYSKGYLNIDKAHFKNWNIGFFNKVTEVAGSFYLKFKAVHFDSSHKNILSSKTYDVISVKEQPVDPEIFEIDHSKIKTPR